MSKLAQLTAVIAEVKETGPNMTEVSKGGGGSRLLPAGPVLCRLVSYIEFGNQPQTFNGVAKAPKPEVQLGFALYGPQYQNEDGTPYILYPYGFAVDQNEKAKAIAIFKAMNWKGDKTHFAEMIGDAWIGKMVHEPKSKSDPKVVSRLDLKGFLPPLDAMSGQPYALPEARDEDIEWFFFERPTMEAWQNLFRDGNFDDGSSKNTLQEKIAGATNFAGSAVEAMLAQAGAPVPVRKAKPATAPAAAPVGTPAVAAPVAAPSVSAPVVAIPLSVITPAISAVAPPITAPVVPVAPVMSAPAISAMTFPSNPALPTLPGQQ